MEEYIGTKIIQAVPAKRYYFDCDPKVLIVACDKEEPEEVKQSVGAVEGYKVRYSDGYESWSPKGVFEEAYRRTDGMNFGLALEAAKMGKKIARAGWNGKGMYVFLAEVNDMVTDADIGEFEGQDVELSDVLVLKTVQDTFQPGWLASQTDMLSDDWYIVE